MLLLPYEFVSCFKFSGYLTCEMINVLTCEVLKKVTIYLFSFVSKIIKKHSDDCVMVVVCCSNAN